MGQAAYSRCGGDRCWIDEAIQRLEADRCRSGDTPLSRLELPGHPHVTVYLKDESAHPSGSLKHRLARALFLQALCSGALGPETSVVDASSGSTAISEAYFAGLLGLPYIAVMPLGTTPRKVKEVERLGARCELVSNPSDVCVRAAALARGLHGCYLDQFTNAERAIDWRGVGNVAGAIVEQMRLERHAVPSWIVCGVGTGGTATSIGRHLRYRQLSTRLCVADAEGSAFARGWPLRDRRLVASKPSLIEGIGRQRVEPSAVFEVVDEVVEVPDAASIAGAWLLEELTGRRYGGSSGANLFATLTLAARMRDAGQSGSIVMLLCDRGERYADSLFDRRWLAQHDVSPDAWLETMRGAVREARAAA